MRGILPALVAGCVVVAGCSTQLPGFLGREGGGSATYDIRGGPAAADPVPLALRSVRLDSANRGVILRADGVAPTQGYYAAAFVPQGDGPDASGILTYALTAVPPAAPQDIGPENTRSLSAAIFLPAALAEDLRGVRVSGIGRSETRAIPAMPAARP